LIDNTKSYNGSNSVHFKGSPSQLMRSLPTGVTRLYMRAYVNMSKSMGADPADNHEHIMGVRKTTDANDEIRVGQIKGVLGTNEVPSDNIAPKQDKWGTGTKLNANTWYCIETGMLTDTAYDELYMWVDGTLVHSITSSADWNNGALGANWLDGKFKYAMFGFHSFSGNTADVWMDDIVVSTSRIGCGNVATSSTPASSIPASSKSSVTASSAAVTASSRAASSVTASTAASRASTAATSSTSNSVGGVGVWSVDATNSFVNFVTTKNVNKVESHKFDTLSGGITDNGIATFTIDLASVNTANTTRDQRMRDLLFETGTYTTATATVNLAANTISSIAVGQTARVDITGSLNLHGVTLSISTKVIVQKLSSTRIMVQNLTPLLIKAADYSLDAGVESLRSVASLTSISTTVPVDFVLFYNAK
jgi:polyisoprenoid-binding protein YceI